ncbi:RNA-directed DNA polymerase from mobile element jockey [Trichonephila clavipes]|nr:RNA-directed DNA polymerase from mobile element jockey [Trichonephila clavipes]
MIEEQPTRNTTPTVDLSTCVTFGSTCGFLEVSVAPIKEDARRYGEQFGLHIDSRLTFKKHIDYLAEKFWGRIHLAISLVGRRSLLSLENKVILYKQILRPVITYGSPVWGAAATTHMKKIHVIQNKILRVMTNAPWYVRNDVIHNDLHMERITNYITKLSRNVFKSIESHDNPIIKAQTLFTYPHPKINYAYSSRKWRNPLRSP